MFRLNIILKANASCFGFWKIQTNLIPRFLIGHFPIFLIVQFNFGSPQSKVKPAIWSEMQIQTFFTETNPPLNFEPKMWSDHNERNASFTSIRAQVVRRPCYFLSDKSLNDVRPSVRGVSERMWHRSKNGILVLQGGRLLWLGWLFSGKCRTSPKLFGKLGWLVSTN